MEIKYIRSSGYGTWDMCQFSYLINYVLGYEQVPRQKTVLGTIFHFVMECLACLKLAHDKQEKTWYNEITGELPVDISDNKLIDVILNAAFAHYTKRYADIHNYSETDKNDIRRWVYDTISLQDGVFDPRKREVVAAEQHFDFPIEEPWAKQEDGEYLRMKGTIDLILKVDDSTYEIVDWKAGARKDWKTEKEKDYNYFCKDFQLQLYYYALHKMYPQIENVFVTINYVKDGGPFTIPFSSNNKEGVLKSIRNVYENIKRCTRPKLKSNNWSHYWCKYVCGYFKTKHSKNPNLGICPYIHNQLIQNGLDFVIQNERVDGFNIGKYTNPGS